MFENHCQVNILNPSYNQLETDLLERDSIIKTLEEDNHKKELVIKEMNNAVKREQRQPAEEKVA